MTTSLIVNADDLGASRAITDGILEAYESGTLTSASLMVNQPASEYAVKRLSGRPGLGVGIHLNLCQGRPVLHPQCVASLVNRDGSFLNPGEMQARLMTWHVSGEEVEAEFRAQIAAVRAMGVEPTHADSHHHMHLFFGAVGPFRRALEAEGIRCIRSCRIRQRPPSRRLGGPHGGFLLRRLGVRAYMEYLEAGPLRGFISPDCRIESPLAAAAGTVGLAIAAWAKTLEAHFRDGAAELVCHPGQANHEDARRDRIHDKRVRELALLTAPGFRRMLESQGISLISYSGLGGGTVPRPRCAVPWAPSAPGDSCS